MSAGRSMATRPSRPAPGPADRGRPRGVGHPLAPTGRGEHHATSEVTIACGVLVGRKPDAFSDRASRCGASSPPSEPREPAYLLTSRRAAGSGRPAALRSVAGRARAPGRRPARTPAACRPAPRQIRSTGATIASPTPNYPLSTQGGRKLNTWAGVTEPDHCLDTAPIPDLRALRAKPP